MKKQYISPQIEFFAIPTVRMAAASVGYNPNDISNAEARSREFWGLDDVEDDWEDEF